MHKSTGGLKNEGLRLLNTQDTTTLKDIHVPIRILAIITYTETNWISYKTLFFVLDNMYKMIHNLIRCEMYIK